MFIKRDLRKIEIILQDNENSKPIETLNFSKRQHEFQGSIQVLLHNISKFNKFSSLKKLNLYDNALVNVNNIGQLGSIVSSEDGNAIHLEEINLGGNKLSALPLDIGALEGLKSIWLEDNEFENFPVSICQNIKLQSLRLSGNSLKFIPMSISSLTKLEILVSFILLFLMNLKYFNNSD